jgi:hypothetical protein
MPYEGGLTSTQRDNLQKDVLSPDSSFLKDAPKRILGFLATYIHASKTLSNPELRSRLLYNNHPESGEHLLFPNDPLMHSAPLFDKTDGYCTNLDYLDIGEQPLDLDFYLQGIQLIIGQISALTHTPGCLPKHVNAIQKLAKLLETKMDQFKLNPCRQTLITIKLELKQAISDSETIFANEPSIWQNNVMPFMNRLIELLNQCLKLFFVPKAYHVTFFKNKTTPIQDAWLESNIKSSLLDEEHGLISKIDSILPENNLYPS